MLLDCCGGQVARCSSGAVFCEEWRNRREHLLIKNEEWKTQLGPIFNY